MPRPRSSSPAYQFHISGKAFVRLHVESGGTKEFYCGPHGSPESYARYYAYLAEYNANGLVMPSNPETTAERLDEDAPILVKHVTAYYRQEKLPAVKSDSHRFRQSSLLDLLDERYGETEAASFGPRKLQELRRIFIKRGNCRRYINLQVSTVIKILKQGVSQELIPASVITGLECVSPLQVGEAKDNPERQPVPTDVVEATIPELTPTAATMVKIQLLTGMRPSELFRMTPAMIDRSGEVWFYRPVIHKTSHKKKQRSIPLVGEALELLTPFLFGDPDQLCFITTKGTSWNKDSYRQAVVRAAKRAKVEHWTPYQLRHAAGQAVRNELGPEAVLALLGQKTARMADVYSSPSEAKAVEAAQITPRICKSC